MKYIKLDLKKYTKETVQEIAREILMGKVVVLPTDTVYGLHGLAINEKTIDKIWKIKKRKLKDQKHFILLVKSFCMIRRWCFLSKKQYDYLKKVWSGKRAVTVILRGREKIILSVKTQSKIKNLSNKNKNLKYEKSETIKVKLTNNNKKKKKEFLAKSQEQVKKTIKKHTIIKLNDCMNKKIVSEDGGVSVRLPKSDFLVDLIKEIDEPVVSTSLNITGQPNLKNIQDVEKYFKTVKPDVIVDAGVLPKRKPSRLVDVRDVENIKVYRK